MALSSGYDAQILVWDLNSGECLQGLFGGHRQAVLDFAWNQSLAVSVDKAGVVAFWDINQGKPLRVSQGHKNSIGKVKFHSSDSATNHLVLTGGLGDG